jgi:hypothetical protein
VARDVRNLAADDGAARRREIIDLDERVSGKFSAARTALFGISTARRAAERTIGGWNDDLALLIGARAREIECLARSNGKIRALTARKEGNFFCTQQKFLRKRVAQFQQFRTTTNK